MSIDERKILDGYGTVDLFAQCLGRIEHIGPCRRLTFVSRNPSHPDTFDVVARLVLSAEALQDLAHMAAADSPIPLVFSGMDPDQIAN